MNFDQNQQVEGTETIIKAVTNSNATTDDGNDHQSICDSKTSGNVLDASDDQAPHNKLMHRVSSDKIDMTLQSVGKGLDQQHNTRLLTNQHILERNNEPVSYNLKRPLISLHRSLTDTGNATSCSESQSSSTGTRTVYNEQLPSPPSHVTFDGETASLPKSKDHESLMFYRHPVPAFTATTRSFAPQDVPVSSPNSFVAPNPVIRTKRATSVGASSEEDSVAEMDYMSENSNISVSIKGMPLDKTQTTVMHPPSINRSHGAKWYGSKRLLDAKYSDISDNLDNPSNPTLDHINAAISSSRRKTKSKLKKNKSKVRHKTKSSVTTIVTNSEHTSAESFQPISNDVNPAAPSVESDSTSYTTTIPESGEKERLSALESLQPSIPAKEEVVIHELTQTLHRDKAAIHLPKFRDPKTCMWTGSHAANSPSEDRSASLVNILLQPLPPDFDAETQLPDLEPDYKTLIRLNLWGVIDGHGGGCVATYGSEVLLPHIAASVARALGCAIVDRGVCTVNSQLRDANALDLDGLIQTQSDRTMGNPNSIHYRSPFERSDSEAEDDDCEDSIFGKEACTGAPLASPKEKCQIHSLTKTKRQHFSEALLHQENERKQNHSQTPDSGNADASISSIKTSVKTTASAIHGEEVLVGTHSPREVADITNAITESFLAVDEAWINSIDPVATHQTSCQSNGRWNSGACALVVFTIQRLDWTSISEPDREKESMEPEKSRRNTTQNRDAARRRMLDYATRTKSASSMSTISSTSSLTTEETVHASGMESEITETEGEDDDRSYKNDSRKRDPVDFAEAHEQLENTRSIANPPDESLDHFYRAHSAMIYTAHVGDCRAVLLGSAPPRTIKVGDVSLLHQDTTDDESSHHSSDETECLSSSDHDADSSEDDDLGVDGTSKSAAASALFNFPRRVVRQRNARNRANDDSAGPYIALPPLIVPEEEPKRNSVEFDFENELQQNRVDLGRRQQRVDFSDSSSASTQDSIDLLPLVHLPPVTRPIDLTTDHSAYNPAEVTAVLRRCSNAPRAISAGVGGGIKRVAGSLAVTRALGDAYLKTPLLSFLPYKSHAPYITARPEVNCRPLSKESDKVLVLATDGVWERASGEDILRWVRNFYEERLAEAVRRTCRRSSNNTAANNLLEKAQLSFKDDVSDTAQNKIASFFQQQEGSERDLFEHKADPSEISVVNNGRKRENTSSPILNSNNTTTGTTTKRRRRSRHPNLMNARLSYNVADVIVRRVLNKVRRARNISSLQALMSLPAGRARRSKHDDITASVIDLSAFIS